MSGTNSYKFYHRPMINWQCFTLEKAMQVGNLHILTADYRKRDGLNHELETRS